jgi:hypothetical protein
LIILLKHRCPPQNRQLNLLCVFLRKNPGSSQNLP